MAASWGKERIAGRARRSGDVDAERLPKCFVPATIGEEGTLNPDRRRMIWDVHVPAFRQEAGFFKECDMSANTVAVTDGSFETEVLQAEEAVLVDFWAEWCGPCKMIAPALEEIGGEYKGKLKVAKINIDDNPEAPTRFGVRSIPTLIVFKGGKQVAQKTGALPKSQLKAWVDASI